jgi:hypothetical protein
MLKIRMQLMQQKVQLMIMIHYNLVMMLKNLNKLQQLHQVYHVNLTNFLKNQQQY